MQVKLSPAPDAEVDPLRSQALALRMPGVSPEAELRTFRLGDAAQVDVDLPKGAKIAIDVRRITRESGPEIQFMNELDFRRLEGMSRLDPGSAIASSYSEKDNVIRVCVPGSGSTPLPERIELSIKDLQRLSATLVHETARANGESEFEAYFKTFRRMKENGIIEEMPSGAEIMEHIRHHHGSEEIEKALAAFERFDETAYVDYMLEREMETPSVRPAPHDFRAGYKHAAIRNAELAEAPRNLGRIAWGNKHPDPVFEYQAQHPFETVQDQADRYKKILNRRVFEEACPLEIPKEASFRTFSPRLESTRRQEEYLQGHMEWKGEMVTAKGFVAYEARYHTNTRVAVNGFPPSVVVHRRVGREGSVLLEDSPAVRAIMNDPREAASFATDRNGNIWVSEDRWNAARTGRSPKDNVILEHGHHVYYPCDQKGQIIR